MEELYKKDENEPENKGDESPQKESIQNKEEINKILTAVEAGEDKEEENDDSNIDDYLRKLEENSWVIIQENLYNLLLSYSHI